MASDERNALAELAEELERFSAENKGLFARRNYLILHKAQRIIRGIATAMIFLSQSKAPSALSLSWRRSSGVI